MLQFRRRVPEELRPFIDKQPGEVCRSLRTRSLQSALPRYLDIAAEVEAMFETARRQRDAGKSADHAPPLKLAKITASDRASMVRRRYLICFGREMEWRQRLSACVRQDPQMFIAGGIVQFPAGFEATLPNLDRPLVADVGMAIQDHASSTLDRLFQHSVSTRLNNCETWLRLDDIGRMRLHLQQNGKEVDDIDTVRALIGAEAAFLRDVADGLASSVVQQRVREYIELDPHGGPVGPMPPDVCEQVGLKQPIAMSDANTANKPNAHAKTTSNQPRLSEVLEDWLRVFAKRRRNQRDVDEARTVFKDFICQRGDQPIQQYTIDDGREFADLLERLPAHMTRHLKKLGLDRCDLFRLVDETEKQGWKCTEAHTINKKCGYLNQGFGWLGTRYSGVNNPFENIRMRATADARSARDPFTVDELNIIFASSKLSPSFRWMLILAIFGSFRLGELCQIRRRHVLLHAQGFMYITLPSHEFVLKNAQSARSVPLHETVMRAGFAEFLGQQEDYLFPDQFDRKAMQDNRQITKEPSKRFSRLLAKIGVKRPRLSFHSARHTWEHECNMCGISGYERKRIAGEIGSGRSARYGGSWDAERTNEQFLQKQHQRISLLHYAGLQITSLQAR